MAHRSYPLDDGRQVHWDSELCTHYELCWRELPGVFDPHKRPWVNVSGAAPDAVVAQVRKCPSGALSSVETEFAVKKLGAKPKTAGLPVSVEK